MKASLLDRGYLAVGIVIGFSVALVSILLVEHLQFITNNETIIGAIIGGVLSGLATLFAVTIGTYFDNKRSHQEQYQNLEADAFSAYSKVTDLLEDITKQYRHHFDSSPHLKLHFSRGSEKKTLTKPLQGRSEKIQFSTAEKSIGLKLKSHELFNDINDLSRISETLHFLREEYRKRFNEFQSATLASGRLDIKGRHVTSEAAVRPLELIELEDISEHLSSFLLKTQGAVREIHQRFSVKLEEFFDRKVELKFGDAPVQAENIFNIPR